jgi:hypothetical protein
MVTAEDESAGLDTVMSHEEQDEALPEKAADGKATYKSFKYVYNLLELLFPKFEGFSRVALATLASTTDAMIQEEVSKNENQV